MSRGTDLLLYIMGHELQATAIAGATQSLRPEVVGVN